MKFVLENYGCTLNQAQGQMIANSLISQGNQLVEDEETADSVLLSTCVVIKHTEDRMRKRIEDLKRKGKDVIVSGCLTHFPLEGIKKMDFSYSYGNLPILKDGNQSVGIPIAEGCNGGCTFCISRIARGRLRSFDEDKILESARKLVDSGAKEIRLTALDTASYGEDSSTNLVSLVRRISDLDGEFMIRIGMMEPENSHNLIDDLLEVMASRKVYKFLHIPFQSGDPLVLRKMGRKYRIEEFIETVKKFREAFPEGMLSTDIIVGFPFETIEGLKKTSMVVREIKPEILNITKYSPRPGTAAFSWKIPPTNQTAQWSQILSEIHRSISEESMRRFIGRKVEVTLLEEGKGGTLMGRDIYYHPVVVRKGKVGEKRNVKIINYSSFYLIAK
jgi:MiaB-like tRNA modifying enzyme